MRFSSLKAGILDEMTLNCISKLFHIIILKAYNVNIEVKFFKHVLEFLLVYV